MINVTDVIYSFMNNMIHFSFIIFNIIIFIIIIHFTYKFEPSLILTLLAELLILMFTELLIILYSSNLLKWLFVHFLFEVHIFNGLVDDDWCWKRWNKINCSA